jgi:hypothetical protein
MDYRTFLLLILIVNCLELGFCYDNSNDQSDIYNQLYYKNLMTNGDQNHHRYKKSLGHKYLILRTSGHQNLGDDQAMSGNTIQSRQKSPFGSFGNSGKNVIELNKVLSMLKKNRNPTKEDLEKYRNLQRIIFSYGR